MTSYNSLSNSNHTSLKEKENMKSKSSGRKTYQASLIWDGTKSDTECEKFKRYVENKYSIKFDSDREFHQWSVEKFEDYLDAVWKYFNIISSNTYREVFQKTGPGFLDNTWFTESTFNYAENLMRFRDDSMAITWEDEEGETDNITYNDMFEEVKLYAAAFRKHGLQKGDTVACHMSNRKEAIFAMLATMSIGAIWGAAVPYLGSNAASNILSKMEPKFFIVVDRHQDNGVEYDIFSSLPTIVENCPTLERVIIVVTKKDTISKGLSQIKNSCYLQDFLESGKLKDKTVPDLIFEQLPASHPVFLSFTSGTTGIAKGTVHSAWVLLHALTNVSFAFDLKRGDVLFSNFPMGWIPLLNYVTCLAIGVKLHLYCGNVYYVKNSRNIWDVISDSKATFVIFIPSQLDKMEKSGMIPKPTSTFEFLRIIGLGSCPVKIQNIEYIYKHITKNTFVANIYGATEFFGAAVGFYLKSPSYVGEMQLPALGVDLRCYNDDGLPVIGELGTAIISTPTLCLPTYLWKDTDHTIMKLNYLSQFPGFWCQSDYCWINPETFGIIIKGRSDDTFVQNGDRFGPGDIYFAIHHMEEIEDYICVAQNRRDCDQRVVLFVKLKEGNTFTPTLKEKIEEKIENELYSDCVPKLILEVKDIPYNVNNKRMESMVRKILATNEIPETVNIRNPACLKYYCDIPEIINYYKL